MMEACGSMSSRKLQDGYLVTLSNLPNGIFSSVSPGDDVPGQKPRGSSWRAR
jgi:hypothetical protein